MVLLIGNAVQNALTYGSGSLLVGLVSAGILLVAEWFMGVLFTRMPLLEEGLSGDPIIIYHDGQFDRRAMRKQGVQKEEVLSATRAMGLAHMSEVHLAVLETDGTISIIPEQNVDPLKK